MMRLRISGVCLFAGFLAACGGEAPSGDAQDPLPAAEDSQAGDAEPAQTGADETALAEIPPPPPSAGDDFDWPAPTDIARIETSKGDIVVELYGAEAPATVANFLQYAADGHYDRTIIHRVVPGFVIQGGGYSQYFDERPTRDPIAYEGANGLKNFRGAIAMARTEDPESAAAQWFINLKDNGDLDHRQGSFGPIYGYAVFGRVIDGMAVADAIGASPTGAGGPFGSEVPRETVLVARIDRRAPEAAPQE